MVVVAVHAGHVVVHTVAIDDDPPPSWYPAHRFFEIERLVVVEVDVPFEREDDAVGRFEIGRAIES
jgi:hypothetical protein